MAQPVIHFETSVNDCARSVNSYSQLFDWKTRTASGFDYLLVEPGNDQSIGSGIGTCQPGQSLSVTFHAGVDDLKAFLDKAEKFGGKSVLPPTPIPGIGACAMVADPDGNVIGLFKG